MFITKPQPISRFSKVSLVTHIKYGVCFSLLFFLFTVTQVVAQDESTEVSLPSIITHKHNNYSFGVPQGWSVETIHRDSLTTILIKENSANVNHFASLLRLEISSRDTSPEDFVKKFILDQEYENLRVLNEVPEIEGYLLFIEWINKYKYTSKGLYFAYREGDNNLVLIGFSAPRERFEALGGSALPITVFSNPWIKLDNSSPTQ